MTLLVPRHIAERDRPRLMLIPHWTDMLLTQRAAERREEWVADLLDESAGVAVDGNPRRSFYLDHVVQCVAEGVFGR